jgi:hypothetical protein
MDSMSHPDVIPNESEGSAFCKSKKKADSSGKTRPRNDMSDLECVQAWIENALVFRF